MARANIYRLGFHWVRSRAQNGLGAQPIERKVVASNNTLGIFIGDMVDELTGGTVYPCTRGGGSYPALAYVVVGVERYKGSDGNMQKGTYLPAATTYSGSEALANPQATVLLCTPVAGQIFAATVPTAESTIATAQAKLNKCIDLNPGTGSTLTGQSGHLIYTGTDGTYGWQATTVSGQLQLVEIPELGSKGLNDVTQAYWTGHFVAYETRGII